MEIPKINTSESLEKNSRFKIITQAKQFGDESGDTQITWAVRNDGVLGTFSGKDWVYSDDFFSEAEEYSYRDFGISYPPTPEGYKKFLDSENSRGENIPDGEEEMKEII